MVSATLSKLAGNLCYAISAGIPLLASINTGGSTSATLALVALARVTNSLHFLTR